MGEKVITLRSIDKNKLVVTQANKLARAHQVMSLQEKRLLLLLISKVRKDDEDFKTYQIPVTEIRGFLGLEKDKDFHNRIREITERLFQRYVKIITGDNPKGWKLLHWVSKAEYIPRDHKENIHGQAYLELELHKEMQPLILQLTERFSQIPFSQLLSIPSFNSVRLFELLYADSLGLKKHKITYDLVDLKNRIGVSGKYPNYTNFNKYVLQRAQRDLKNSTAIYFTYKPIKSGRKVTDIEFIVFSNKKLELEKKNKEIEEKPKKKPEQTKSISKNPDLERKLIAAGWRGGADKIIEQYGAELVEETLKLAKERQAQLANTSKAIKNLGGLINKFLREGTAKEALELKKNKKQEKDIAGYAEKITNSYHKQRLEYSKKAWEELSQAKQDKIHKLMAETMSRFEIDQIKKTGRKGVLYTMNRLKAMEESGEFSYPENLQNIENYILSSKKISEFTEETRNKIIALAKKQ